MYYMQYDPMVRRHRHWRRPRHHRLWHQDRPSTHAPRGAIRLAALQGQEQGALEGVLPVRVVIVRRNVDVVPISVGYIPQLQDGEHTGGKQM